MGTDRLPNVFFKKQPGAFIGGEALCSCFTSTYISQQVPAFVGDNIKIWATNAKQAFDFLKGLMGLSAGIDGCKIGLP